MVNVTQRAREMQRVLRQWRKSGLSKAEFCRRHGLAVQTLHWWRKRLGDERVEPVLEFVEVDVPVVQSAQVFEVMLPGGAVVRVGERFDDRVLARLLKVVRDAC